jgi:ParB-like chromosome segregation protein Spo0J
MQTENTLSPIQAEIHRAVGESGYSHRVIAQRSGYSASEISRWARGLCPAPEQAAVDITQAIQQLDAKGENKRINFKARKAELRELINQGLSIAQIAQKMDAAYDSVRKAILIHLPDVKL